MAHENGRHGNFLYSFIPLEDFKALLGIGVREEDQPTQKKQSGDFS
jgi:hypothetical protein